MLNYTITAIDTNQIVDGMFVHLLHHPAEDIYGVYHPNCAELIAGSPESDYDRKVIVRHRLNSLPLKFRKLGGAVIQEVLYNLNGDDRKPEFIPAVALITRTHAVIGLWDDPMALFLPPHDTTPQDHYRDLKPTLTYAKYESVYRKGYSTPKWVQTYSLTGESYSRDGECPFWMDDAMYRLNRRINCQLRRWRGDTTMQQQASIQHIKTMMREIYESAGKRMTLSSTRVSDEFQALYTTVMRDAASYDLDALEAAVLGYKRVIEG